MQAFERSVIPATWKRAGGRGEHVGRSYIDGAEAGVRDTVAGLSINLSSLAKEVACSRLHRRMRWWKW